MAREGCGLMRSFACLLVLLSADLAAQPRSCTDELAAQRERHGRSAFAYACQDRDGPTVGWASATVGRGRRSTRVVVEMSSASVRFVAQAGIVRNHRFSLVVDGRPITARESGRYQHGVDFDFDDAREVTVVIGPRRIAVGWADLRQRLREGDAEVGRSNFGTVALLPGFLPDPHIVQGTSGGSTDANTLSSACVGYISSPPDHLLNVEAAFAHLRVMAHSQADVTLVIERPDGSYLCNDDFDGVNPLVAGAFPIGVYKIWVGSYERGTNSPYTLGFSELLSVRPSSL